MHFRLHNTGKKHTESPEEHNIFSCRAAAHEHDKWLTQRRQGNAELSRMTSSFCAGLKVIGILKLAVGNHLRRTRNHSTRKCTQADDSTHGLFWSHISPQRPAAAEQMWRVGSVLGGVGGGGSYLWQLPPSVTAWNSPKEGDEELHQVHDAVVLREGNLEKEENAWEREGNIQIYRINLCSDSCLVALSIRHTARQWCERSWQSPWPPQEPRRCPLVAGM